MGNVIIKSDENILIILRNGKEENWCSEEYLKKQVERAYRAGIHRGIKVEFHAMAPIDKEGVTNLINEFKKKVEKEYKIAFENDEVWYIPEINLGFENRDNKLT